MTGDDDTPTASTASSRPRRAAQRSAARLAAVQARYQIESRGMDPQAVVEEFRRHRLTSDDVDEGQPDLTKADTKHFAALVLGTDMRAGEIAEALDGVLPADWPRARLDRVVHAILITACFELLARDDVPARVAIDEYVSIARAFFAGVEPNFVNGVLDALARKLRPSDFVPGHDRGSRE
ncbi:MAG: transcription antitermination factor NusB [Alphaproteobacteria bacterium]|nr:transcription antitermination factor NusB [Alphaproteobacteria bacterium]